MKNVTEKGEKYSEEARRGEELETMKKCDRRPRPICYLSFPDRGASLLIPRADVTRIVGHDSSCQWQRELRASANTTVHGPWAAVMRGFELQRTSN